MTTPISRHQVDPQQQKHIYATIAAFIICTQFKLLEMAQPEDKAPKEKAYWTEQEVDHFLEYIITQKSKITGSSTFKDTTLLGASQDIASLWQWGPVKTMDHCKNKWASGEATESMWDEYINASNSNKIMKQFKNSGWRHYAAMQDILPGGSSAQGTATYNPASAAAQIVSALPPAGVSAGPVAGSSLMLPPAPTSSSSTGKCSHSDMISSHSAPPSTIETSVTSSEKKPWWSAAPSSMSHGASSSHAGTSKKAAKEATSTAAFMNLQGSIKRLTDSLTTTLTTTTTTNET
ncbi:hypothetical protein DFH29DRAFT_1000022 [Suillus ampliporus]|nr:hypothetical protein DFH29DRAFT_1000022 [Suillus ampliporus]